MRVVISLGSAVALANSEVTVVASLTTAGRLVAGTGNDITFDRLALSLTGDEAPTLGAPANCVVDASRPKTLVASVVDVSANSVTVRVFVQGSQTNNVAMPDGPLYRCTFRTRPGALPGTYSVSVSNTIAEDPMATPLVPVTGVSGAINIQLVVPTATPTNTLPPTSTPANTPTGTPTATGTTTATATSSASSTPTQTPTPVPDTPLPTPTGIASLLSGEWFANWQNTVCFLDGVPSGALQDTTYVVTAVNGRLDIDIKGGAQIARGAEIGQDGSVAFRFTSPSTLCPVSGRRRDFVFDYVFNFGLDGFGNATAAWSYGVDSFCAVCFVSDSANLVRTAPPPPE